MSVPLVAEILHECSSCRRSHMSAFLGSYRSAPLFADIEDLVI